MTLIALSALVVLAGAYLADRTSAQQGGIGTPLLSTPLITKLNGQADRIRQAHTNRCLPRPWFRWHPGHLVPGHMRQYVIRQRAARLERVRARASRCASVQAWAWHNGSAASCVRSKEGGLTSVNPAGPYYGWYQTDPSFQAAYGPEFHRQWGSGIWPAFAQVLTAYRGWQARGWYPWPNTARACGLL